MKLSTSPSSAPFLKILALCTMITPQIWSCISDPRKSADTTYIPKETTNLLTNPGESKEFVDSILNDTIEQIRNNSCTIKRTGGNVSQAVSSVSGKIDIPGKSMEYVLSYDLSSGVWIITLYDIVDVKDGDVQVVGGSVKIRESFTSKVFESELGLSQQKKITDTLCQ